MAAPIGSLVVKVGSDVSQLVIGFDKSKKSTKDFGRAVAKAAKILTGFGVAAGIAGTALAVKFTKDGLESIDTMVKLGRTVGATQGEMVGLARAAELVGVEQSKMTSTVQRFTKRIGEAREGTGSAVTALGQLGLKAEELAAMPLPEAIGLVAERIQGLTDAAGRAAVASDIFGRTGSELVLTTRNLSDSLRLGAKQTREFGVAVSQLDAEDVEAANDAMSSLSLVFKGMANQAAVVLAPALVTISEKIKNSAKESTGFRGVLIDLFKTGITFAFSFQDSLNFAELSLQKFAKGSLEAQLAVTKLLPSTTLEDLRNLNNQIDGLALRIRELQKIPRAELRADKFFKEIEERINAARKKLEEGETDDRSPEEKARDIIRARIKAQLEEEIKGNEEKAKVEEENQRNLAAIEQRWATARQQFEKQHLSEKVASVTGAFASVTAMVADQNKEMFEINKAFQIADAIVNGIAGAIRTWNSVPYPWNIPLTIAHVAGTAAQVANLSSQQFQGGRSGGGGGVPATPSPGPGPGGGGGGGGGDGGGAQTVNIALQGRSFGRQEVRQLIEEINDATDDGARIRVVD